MCVCSALVGPSLLLPPLLLLLRLRDGRLWLHVGFVVVHLPCCINRLRLESATCPEAMFC